MSQISLVSGQEYLWWRVKVLCGVILIIGVFDRFLGSNFFSIVPCPLYISQIIVTVGVAINLWHFFILKRVNQNISEPQQLVHKYGLYRYIRHPMYLADAIYYLGLALIWCSATSFFILLISYIALAKQSQEEDKSMAQRFKDQYPEWWMKTGLMIPFLY